MKVARSAKLVAVVTSAMLVVTACGSGDKETSPTTSTSSLANSAKAPETSSAGEVAEEVAANAEGISAEGTANGQDFASSIGGKPESWPADLPFPRGGDITSAGFAGGQHSVAAFNVSLEDAKALINDLKSEGFTEVSKQETAEDLGAMLIRGDQQASVAWSREEGALLYGVSDYSDALSGLPDIANLQDLDINTNLNGNPFSP